jgi:hypothetical protein
LAYNRSAGFARPTWLDYPQTSDPEEGDDYKLDEINNTIGALKKALLRHFNQEYNRYIRNLADRIDRTDNGYSLSK